MKDFFKGVVGFAFENVHLVEDIRFFFCCANYPPTKHYDGGPFWRKHPKTEAAVDACSPYGRRLYLLIAAAGDFEGA